MGTAVVAQLLSATKCVIVSLLKIYFP